MAWRVGKLRGSSLKWLGHLHLAVTACVAVVICAQARYSVRAAEEKPSPKKPTRLIDRQPFDRIILNAANGNETIDTQLLDLPNRSIPDPLPTDGSLELRRLSDPSVLYKLSWGSIARIELYEQLLLKEAAHLAEASNLPEAYEYLSFLHNNYSDLPGLSSVTETYLRQDARASFRSKDYEETFTILLSLYDLNPQHAGLKRFVEVVTDRLISKYLADRDFAAARSVLDTLSSTFPELGLTNVGSWRGKFEAGAGRQLKAARLAIEQERFLDARRAVRQSLAILPNADGAQELLNEIDRRSPQILVGVYQLPTSHGNDLEWSTARVKQLTHPKMLRLTGFGAEGGKYTCTWADMTADDTGQRLDLHLNDSAIEHGITAENLVLALLSQAETEQPQYRADFAKLVDTVDTNQGMTVSIGWQRSHVRPEALLPLALEHITQTSNPPGTYQASTVNVEDQLVTYQLPKGVDATRGPETIIEKFYDNEDLAFSNLLGGEIDALARVPPWQLSRLQQTEGVTVSPYRLPSIHVLIPNYDKAIMRRREFRRAVCYGIDRPQILNDILLGGEQRPGYRVLSGPLPAGVTLTDPVGYAYNQGLKPRSYRPRLAAVLATVARNSLAKMNAARKKEESDEGEGETAGDEPEKAAVAESLVLAHPPSPIATLACQSMQLQLGAVGIPVKLLRLTPDVELADTNYDLRYVELAMWEPIVDVRRLLGPNGMARNCSSSMSLALSDVDLADNWKEARTRLQEVHRIAFNDLQVIPLWQTVNFFAHRNTLRGIGKTPVMLYQNVADWRRAVRGAGL